ncbi:MAG: hypothetical protein KC656_31830, partial [Myxococcales bacterium]|nr:hypothetical protein [Myxococcales bacterium]
MADDAQIQRFLRYLEDPRPEDHDHAEIEEALADPAQRGALLEAVARSAPEKALASRPGWWENWLRGFDVK